MLYYSTEENTISLIWVVYPKHFFSGVKIIVYPHLDDIKGMPYTPFTWHFANKPYAGKSWMFHVQMALRQNDHDPFSLVTSIVITPTHNISNSSNNGCKYTSMFSFFTNFFLILVMKGS